MSTIHPSASDANFAELQRDPFFDVAVDLIADYLGDAFDDPAGGEVDRWTLSALPATNKSARQQRLFTLNIGPMEALTVERFDESDGTDYAVMCYLSLTALERESGCTLDELGERNSLLGFRRSGLASADGDAAVIGWVVSEHGADEQFFDLPLAQAIRPLADHLATKGRGPYAQYHNRAFAAPVLARVTGDD